jgi:hypothetical protein
MNGPFLAVKITGGEIDLFGLKSHRNNFELMESHTLYVNIAKYGYIRRI